MRTRHSLRPLAKYPECKLHARYLLSQHLDTCLHMFAWCARVRLFCILSENRFRRRETEENEIERERGGPTRKKSRKTRVSTDVTLARSTWSDARWSCLVYPNYLLSPRPAEWCTFTVIFYLFFPHRMMHYASNRCCRNASRNVVFIL